MSRLRLIALLPLAACIDYDITTKDDNPDIIDEDTGVPCPPQIPDCYESDPPESEPPDTDPPEPSDCDVMIPSSRTVQVLSECEGEGALQEVTDPWNVTVEWQWTGLSSNRAIQDVITTPVIGNLTDDNGDGRIDENDTPDVMTVASMESNFTNGTLVILDGATGAEVWTASGYDASGGGALADLDGDSSTDIIVFNSSEQVVALDANGNRMWTSSDRAGTYPQATVADLDADGHPEVIADTLILNGQTGALIARLAITGSIPYRMPAVGDLDQDGDQEVIVGSTVYDHRGTRLWSTTITGTYGHWAAIVDADGDPEAEVVMIGGGAFGVYEHDGTETVRRAAGATQPGAPCAADFDGDGEVEIAWGSAGTFQVVNMDGSIVWSSPIDDTSGLASDPYVQDVITTPVIGNLTDDNGDGQIDEDDVPDVMTVATRDSSFWSGTLVLLDGATGAEIWSSYGFDASGGGALADLDGDSSTDIIAFNSNDQAVALDAYGNRMWVSTDTTAGYPQATVADLDGDGNPEVIADSLILNGQTGATIRRLPISRSIPYRMPAVGDLDQDGTQEIIVGDTVYDHQGNALWSTTILGNYGHWSAIVDADGDPEAEVVMIGGGAFGVYEHDGTETVRVAAGSTSPGAPCAADFDGDGEVEIGWGSAGVFQVVNMDGSVVWSAPVNDSSGLASCSGFDINGDLVYEVLFADQDTMWIFDGPTGTALYAHTDHASGTLWEYPAVADVDADGSAEIVIGSNNAWYSGWAGITVFGHDGDGWPRSGTTWHVHDFAVTNILPDGSVPPVPVPWWQEYNVYRARPAVDDPNYPDLRIAVHDLCVASCETGPVKIAVQAQNQGGADIEAGVPWAFYRNDNGVYTFVTGGALPEIPSGTAPTGFVIEVMPGDFGSEGFVLAVDDDGSGFGDVNECDESNNLEIWGDRICQ